MRHLLLSLIAGFVIMSGYSFRQDMDVAMADEILWQSQSMFRADLAEWASTASRYLHVTKEWARGEVTLESLRTAHVQTRLAYKQVELFVDYYDPYAVRRYINGAPLPSIDRSMPGINILEPEGLQILDELLFSNSPEALPEDILALVQTLHQQIKSTVTFQSGLSFQHRHVMEACRLEAIRVFTLGLTGFDTPGSGMAIPEAKKAMQVLFRQLLSYRPLLEQKTPELVTELEKLSERSAQIFSEQTVFEDFDRLNYLMTVTNPLLDLLSRMQSRLGIEFPNETPHIPGPLNHRAGNLFSPDILDASYYSRIVMDAGWNARVRLGKWLFYDPILSRDMNRSCASCHHPEKAFTDGLSRSMALDGYSRTLRNAPTLIHSVYAEHYFLDLRESFLERQIKHVVLDEKEFATDFFTLADRLKESPAYNAAFAEAFPAPAGPLISQSTISQALAAYVGTLTGWNSPFDRFVRREGQELSEDAQRGFNLFMGKAACGTCHFAPTFNGTVPPLYTETESEVLGIPANRDSLHPIPDTDPGRWANQRPHDQAPFYYGSFKTVTVRNTALTGPYMHNGIFESLEEVIDFYNRGGGQGLGMNIPHQTLPSDPLDLSPIEISDILVFLHSLTDTTGMTARPDRLPRFPKKTEWDSRLSSNR